MLTVLRPAVSTTFNLLFQTHLGTVEHLGTAPGWRWQGLVQPWLWARSLGCCTASLYTCQPPAMAHTQHFGISFLPAALV